MRSLAVLVCVSALVAACGADGDPDDPNDPNDPNQMNNMSGPGASLGAVATLPATAQQKVIETTQIAVQAVYVATFQSGTGQIVTTGTITETASGATWAPTPTDKMVVMLQNGKRGELVWRTLQGNFNVSASEFLNREYSLDFSVKMDGALDLAIQATSVSQTAFLKGKESHISGTYVDGGKTYTVDLRSRGTSYFETGSTGTEYDDKHTTSGSLRAEGLEVVVDESWSYEQVISGGTDDTAAIKDVRSRLMLGGDTFQWVNTRIKKSFRNGKPSQLDSYWFAGGTVTRNGEAYGVYTFLPALLPGGTSGGQLRFVIDTPAGQVELEKWNAF